MTVTKLTNCCGGSTQCCPEGCCEGGATEGCCQSSKDEACCTSGTCCCTCC